MYKKLSIFGFVFILLIGIGLYYRHQIRTENYADAALQSGYMNLKHGHKLKAMGDFSFVAEHYSQSRNITVQKIVTKALLEKANILINLNDIDGSIITLEHLVHLYPDTKNKELQHDIAVALFKEGTLLMEKKQYQDAMISFSHFVTLYDENKNIEIKRMLAQAMYNEAEILSKIGNSNTGLNIHASILARFMRSDEAEAKKDPVIELVMAKSLMARTANRLNNREWSTALENSNLFIKLFNGSNSPIMKDFFAHNLLYRAEILHRVTNIPEDKKDLFGKDPQTSALKAYDQLLTTTHDETSGEYPRYRATALLGKAQIIIDKNQLETALSLCNQIYNDYLKYNVPKIQLVVAKSLLTKADILIKQKQLQAALSTYNVLLKTYKPNPDDSRMNSVILDAYINKSKLLNLLNQQTDAIHLLNKAIDLFQGTKDNFLYHKVAQAFMEKALLQKNIKQLDQAILTYTAFIAVAHHSDYEPTRYLGALAILKKAELQHILHQGIEIGQTYDQLVNFYKTDKNIKIKRVVAQGMYNNAVGLFEHNRGYTAIGTIKEIFKLFEFEENTSGPKVKQKDPEINKILKQTEVLKKKLGDTIVW